MKTTSQTVLAGLLCLSLAAGPARAEMLRPDPFDAQRARVEQILIDNGVDATEASARAAALSDEEVIALAARFDEMPAGAGGDPRAIVAMAGVIIAVYVVVTYWPLFLAGGVVLLAMKSAPKTAAGDQDRQQSEYVAR